MNLDKGRIDDENEKRLLPWLQGHFEVYEKGGFVGRKATQDTRENSESRGHLQWKCERVSKKIRPFASENVQESENRRKNDIPRQETKITVC